MLQDLTVHTDHRERADLKALMDDCMQTDVGTVVDCASAGKSCGIRHLHMTAHDAVMCDVAISHHIVVIADESAPTGWQMNGRKLTKSISFPDFNSAPRIWLIGVLRLLADDDVGMEYISRCKPYWACDDYAVTDEAVRSNFDLTLDRDVVSNTRVLAHTDVVAQPAVSTGTDSLVKRHFGILRLWLMPPYWTDDWLPVAPRRIPGRRCRNSSSARMEDLIPPPRGARRLADRPMAGLPSPPDGAPE